MIYDNITFTFVGKKSVDTKLSKDCGLFCLVPIFIQIYLYMF